MYEAKVLADSVSPKTGERLTTIQATFPRFILSEFNTHRVFSRNSASFRAIPTEKLIQQVRNDPFVPEQFRTRVKGMGQGELLLEDDHAKAERAWLFARDDAIFTAEYLNELNISKSIANRVLEPFVWHTAIISSTQWSNFFALRCPIEDEVDFNFPAQPEFQHIAIRIRTAMRNNVPEKCIYHLPLVNEELDISDPEFSWKYWQMVSAGRCARVSYFTNLSELLEGEHADQSYERAQKLKAEGHMSPFEHPAKATEMVETNSVNGNFSGGWMQFRKTIPYEYNIEYMMERKRWNNL